MVEIKQLQWNSEPSTKLVREAIRTAAHENPYDPVVAYLNSLTPVGPDLLDEWLVEAGAEDSPLVRAIGRRLLIAMVARAYVPGCQAREMVVLEGEQNTGKSKLAKALGDAAGDEYAISTLLAAGSKDATQVIVGRWVTEFAEMASVHKSDLESLKDFVSRQADTFRWSYGEDVRTYPRKGVLVGSTNDAQYLLDDTGGTRFLPVKFKGEVNVEWVRAHRDQLFARAVKAFKAGERWWFDAKLDPELVKELRARQESRRVANPKEALVREILSERARAGEKFVTTKDVFDAWMYDPERRTKGAEREVAGILRLLGCEQAQIGKERHRGYRLPVGLLRDRKAKPATVTALPSAERRDAS